MTNNNTGLAIVQQSAAIEPRDMNELRAMAKAAAASKFYGAQTEEAALMLLMMGRDLGLSYSQALRAFHVNSQGKPSLSAAGMVAVCLRSGLCEYFETVEATDAFATVRAKRKGRPERQVTFTIEDAKRAKLLSKEVWQSYPSRMLLARAQSFAAREVFQDLLMGMYDEDELDNDRAPAAPVQPPAVRVAQPARVTHDADGVVLEDDRVTALLARIERAEDQRSLDTVGREIASLKSSLAPSEVDALKSAFAKHKADLRAIEAERARMAEPVEAVLESPAPPAVEEVGT